MGKEIDFSSSNAIESSPQDVSITVACSLRSKKADLKPERHTAHENRVIEARKKKEVEENRS